MSGVLIFYLDRISFLLNLGRCTVLRSTRLTIYQERENVLRKTAVFEIVYKMDRIEDGGDNHVLKIIDLNLNCSVLSSKR